MTYFGTSAPFLLACRKAGVVPRDIADLSRAARRGLDRRAAAGRGLPLGVRGGRDRLQLQSISGGTDVCTGFVGAARCCRSTPGEIAVPLPGREGRGRSTDGQPVIGELGELVITAPMPSMPVGFWNDPDGSRYRRRTSTSIPGVWRPRRLDHDHRRGTCVITGRSDATLNRGGVRLGTSEFYSVVEGLDEVVDSVVVHLEDADGGAGELLLFVVLADGVELDDALRGKIGRELRTALSPRHVPDEIHQVRAVPRTLSGKKLEVPVTRRGAVVPVEADLVMAAVAAGARSLDGTVVGIRPGSDTDPAATDLSRWCGHQPGRGPQRRPRGQRRRVLQRLALSR